MCRVGRDVLRRLRRHARARAGQLRCVLAKSKDKPAEFQNKIFLGRNMCVCAPTHNKKADKQCR